MDPAILWLGLVIILLIIEIATMGLTTIWFAGGAMAAFFSTFFGATPATQRTIFLVLSLALLVVTRPAAVKYMRGSRVKTNAESLIGRLAVVTAEINNLAQSGEVIISDVSWTARSRMDSNVIPVGSKVKICAIEGVKLIVEKAEEEQ
ncbi:MAG: NfeD family protein [Lachnospiraceae bacterium]|nr:NfeD family protein [Lachnospiraceae bacterium]